MFAAIFFFIHLLIFSHFSAHAMKIEKSKKEKQEDADNMLLIERRYDLDFLYRIKHEDVERVIYSHELPYTPAAQIRSLLPIHSISDTELLVVMATYRDNFHERLNKEGDISLELFDKSKEMLCSLAAFIINPQTQTRVCEPEIYYTPKDSPSSPDSFKNKTLEQYKHLLKKKYAGHSLCRFMKKNIKTVLLPDFPTPLKNVSALSYTPKKDMVAVLLYDGDKIGWSGVSHECVIFRKIGTSFKTYALLPSYNGFIDLAWNAKGTLLATEEMYGVTFWSPELPYALISLSNRSWQGDPRGIVWDSTKDILYRGFLVMNPDCTHGPLLKWDLEKDITNALEKECNRVEEKITKISRNWGRYSK